jgi:AraC-like DNA-binding protein
MSALAPPFSFSRIELVDRPWFPYMCTEVEHWVWETKGDEHFNFWVALSGEGYLTCDEQTFAIKPGSFFIFSPRQRISAAHYGGPPITRFSAHFLPVVDSQITEKVPELPLLGGFLSTLEKLHKQIDLIMRIAIHREDDEALAQKLYYLIEHCYTHYELGIETLIDADVAEAIRSFRTEPASILSITEIAKELGLSRSHFDRKFTKQVGHPPQKFLLNCKMIHARRLLESSQLRIGEVAETLGYRDIYFFSRQFKQFFRSFADRVSAAVRRSPTRAQRTDRPLHAGIESNN